MKKTCIQHPSLEQIADSQLNLHPWQRGRIQTHIKNCESCATEAEKFARLTITMQQIESNKTTQSVCGQLSEAEIVSFINETGSPHVKEKVVRHMQACGQCAKVILLSKTRWFAQQAEHSGLVENIEVEATPRSVKKPIVQSVLWPVAASVLVAILVMVFVRSQDSIEQPVVQAKYRNTSRSQEIGDAGIIKTSNGVSWYDGYIQATGIGTADMTQMSNKIQAESMATKAARHIAYAKISEATNGVYVSGKVTYQQLLSQSDALVVRHEGIVRNAKIVQEKLEWIEHSPKATVTIRVPLYGENSLGSVALESPTLASVDVDQWQRLQPHAFRGQASVQYVIDARDCSFEPVLLPVIAVNDPSQGNRYIARINWPHYFPSIAAAKHAIASDRKMKLLKATRSDNGIVTLKYNDVGNGDFENSFSLDHVSIVY